MALGQQRGYLRDKLSPTVSATPKIISATATPEFEVPHPCWMIDYRMILYPLKAKKWCGAKKFFRTLRHTYLKILCTHLIVPEEERFFNSSCLNSFTCEIY